jgi:excisionase family DNA binding protein
MKTNVIEEKMIYTTHEVAKILHSSPNYIYELIKKGKLKAVKLKSLKIRKSALEEFLQENEGNDLSDLENIKKLNNEEMDSNVKC